MGELCEGTGDYLSQLKYALKHLGWKLEWASSGNVAEDYYGFLLDDQGRVINVVFEGPADDAGIGQEMRITSINGIDIHRNGKEVMQSQTGDIVLTVEDKWREYNVEVKRRSKPFKRKAVLVDIEETEWRKIWAGPRIN
jgi:predicted metalloprotease with PDZ domain